MQETLFPGTPNEMISMYHLADGQLVMTHYCAMGNQPRMKLDAQASTPDKLVFAFDGGTNFDPAKDGHVHSGSLTLGRRRAARRLGLLDGRQGSGPPRVRPAPSVAADRRAKCAVSRRHPLGSTAADERPGAGVLLS